MCVSPPPSLACAFHRDFSPPSTWRAQGKRSIAARVSLSRLPPPEGEGPATSLGNWLVCWCSLWLPTSLGGASRFGLDSEPFSCLKRPWHRGGQFSPHAPRWGRRSRFSPWKMGAGLWSCRGQVGAPGGAGALQLCCVTVCARSPFPPARPPPPVLATHRGFCAPNEGLSTLLFPLTLVFNKLLFLKAESEGFSRCGLRLRVLRQTC